MTYEALLNEIESLLDGASIMELHEGLKFVLAEVKRVGDEDPGNYNDPRLARLMGVMDIILYRIDERVFEYLHDEPAALAAWNETIDSCGDLNDDLVRQLRPDIESSSIS